MKKFLIITALCFSSLPIFAAPWNIYWDFGTAYLGGFASADFAQPGFECEADLQFFDFRLETESGITFAVSPFNLWGVLDNNLEEDIYLATFANFTVSYDFLKYNRNLDLSPYVSAFALSVEDSGQFRIDAGVSFNLYGSEFWPRAMAEAEDSVHLRGELISAKTGIRLNRLKPEFYFDFGFNFLSLIIYNCIDLPVRQ